MRILEVIEFVQSRPAMLPAYQTIAGTIIAIAIVATIVYYIARKRSK
ncbi:MAG: hypothetical protein MRT15_06795 [archaeon YNP-LCB-003-016]|nr:hypothetical protein [Candidatus Culexarchaeum yellowstonense]MCR6692079.1 hypothetical protein [Candidatus Culexarchaeum yellowstonense]